MKLSIVTTLYRSAATIEEFYRRSIKAAEQVAGDIELVIVNDGSPDNSLDLALELHKHDPRVIVVDLSRNFGHHKALMTGLAHASGDLVFLIDSDLEERPEDLAALYQRFSQNDCDVVFGVLPTRRGGFLKRLPGAVFFSLLDFLSDYPVPRNVFTARLMTEAIRQGPGSPSRPRICDIPPLGSHRVSPTARRAYQAVAVAHQLYAQAPRRDGDTRRHDDVEPLLYLIFYTGLLIFGLSIAVILCFLGPIFHVGNWRQRFHLDHRLDLVPRRPDHVHPRNTRHPSREHSRRDQAQTLHNRSPNLSQRNDSSTHLRHNADQMHDR